MVKPTSFTAKENENDNKELANHNSIWEEHLLVKFPWSDTDRQEGSEFAVLSNQIADFQCRHVLVLSTLRIPGALILEKYFQLLHWNNEFELEETKAKLMYVTLQYGHFTVRIITATCLV